MHNAGAKQTLAILPQPPDSSPQRASALERRVQQLTELVAARRSVLVLTHNDPDPDAISSGWALQRLLEALAPKTQITLAHGGMIGRAENRAMAQLFTPHIMHIPRQEVEERLKKFDGVILVDTQPAAGNHLLSAVDHPPEDILAALDHHPPRRSQMRAVVHDVRPEVGATATLLCDYLAAAQFDVDPALATALFYGVKSDTRGLSRHTSDLDIWAYSALRNLVDTDLLNRIEQVRLPRAYFRGISDALANTMLYACSQNGPADNRKAENEGGSGVQPCYGYVAVSLLLNMQRPDMAAEVADLLMRMEEVSWAIGLGVHEDRLVISVRTDAPEGRAGRLVRAIVGKMGTAGGHDTMAGGRIPRPDATPTERIAELHALVPRFLQALGAGESVGEPLLKAGE